MVGFDGEADRPSGVSRRFNPPSFKSHLAASPRFGWQPNGPNVRNGGCASPLVKQSTLTQNCVMNFQASGAFQLLD